MLWKTIGETGGLGTVATRADIIEKLFHAFLMEKKGNEIYLTSKAKQLLKPVPERSEGTGTDSQLGDEAVKDCKGADEAAHIHERDQGVYL